jgi:hypothetical protein
MIYELRIYHCMPGRLPALNERFQSKTLAIWKKHSITPVGFWTVVIGASNHDLYYLLAWKDLAEREAKWNAFSTDPEWLATRTETERNGPLMSHFTNYILAPTAYSPMK